ncbi:MAG TPA: DUF2079 domain-containing protein [Candidatus Omnitrophota bacterium]|nr:DUF2079 domain-containing protein [Candidatus Omnitrophota bacterium]
MEKIKTPTRSYFYRFGEIVFFLLIVLYFTGGFPFLPAGLSSFFDVHPKIQRKTLVFIAGGAAVLGVLLLEWAQRDKPICSKSLLMRILLSWKTSATGWVIGLFLLFGSWWTASSILRYESMNAGFDMAIFTQAVWNTTQGHWFYSSIKGGISLLGDHFAPFLAVIAVPYKIWPDPKILLAIQAFAAAACLFPLTKIIRRSGQSPLWEVLFCIAFVLYLPVRNAVRFEFHPEVIAMPFLLYAFAYLKERKIGLASLCLTASLFTKENIATVAFAIGFYAMFLMPRPCLMPDESSNKRPIFFKTIRLWGMGWMLFSLFYFFMVTQWAIPKLSGAPYFYLDGNFTSWVKAGWVPFAKHVFNTSTLSYLAKIYGPLAFTSMLAPGPFLLTLPTLAQNLLSRNEMTRSIFFQYTATLTPFVFISSVVAMAKIRRFRSYWAYGILLASVLTSGVSEIYPMRRNWIAITPHTKEVAAILRTIPAEYSLRTHEFYATHAANRKELHIYENDHPKEGGSWKARHTDLIAIDRQLLKENADTVLNGLKNSGYSIILEQNGFFILRRVADPRK